MAKHHSREGRPGLTSEEVLALSHSLLRETLPVSVQSDTYTKDDLIDSLLYAASRKTTLERTGACVEGVPNGNTTRGYLKETTVAEVEEAINEALILKLPRVF